MEFFTTEELPSAKKICKYNNAAIRNCLKCARQCFVHVERDIFDTHTYSYLLLRQVTTSYITNKYGIKHMYSIFPPRNKLKYILGKPRITKIESPSNVKMVSLNINMLSCCDAVTVSNWKWSNNSWQLFRFTLERMNV